jgi:hypothetical protein
MSQQPPPGGYPPPQGGYPPQGAYPPQGGYPPQGPQQPGGYPQQPGGYPPQGPPPQAAPTPPKGEVKHDFVGYWNRALAIFMKDPVNWIIIGLVGFAALGVGMWGGFQRCYLIDQQGGKPTVQDVIWPFKSGRGLDLFLGSLVAGIGGPFTMALWGFNAPVQVDQGPKWRDAMTIGKQETGKNYVAYLIFFFVGMVIMYIPLVGWTVGPFFIMECYKEKFGLHFAALQGAGAPAQLAAGPPMGGPQGQPQQWGHQEPPPMPPPQWGQPQQEPPPMPPPQWGPPQGPPQGPPPGQPQWGQGPQGPPPGQPQWGQPPQPQGPPQQGLPQWGPPQGPPQGQPQWGQPQWGQPQGPPPGQAPWGQPPAGYGQGGGAHGGNDAAGESPTVAMDSAAMQRMAEATRQPAPQETPADEEEIYGGKTQALEIKPVVRQPDGSYACGYCSNRLPPDAKATCPFCGAFLIGM